MKRYAFIFSVMAAFGFLLHGGSTHAQIAYVNFDAVLQLMPETQTMEQELRIYENRQSAGLKLIADSLRAGREELVKQEEGETSSGDITALVDSLEAMRQRLVSARKKAEEGLTFRRNLYMQEILAKINRNIAALAEEEGFSYVFNSQAGGTSVLVHTPDGVNLTRELLVRMQVPLPEVTDSE